MTDKLKEDMSALVDGELELESTSETVDMLIESDALKRCWVRYHMMRDVLRHQIYPDAGNVLCERVRKCLAGEPPHFAAPAGGGGRWRGALKPMLGVALAASVAAVAVIAVRTAGPPRGDPEAAAPPARIASVDRLPEKTLTSAALPAANQAGAATGGFRRLQWTTSEPAVANRLNGYLVSHSEYQGGAMNGMHPYARIVGYDSSGQR